MNRIIIIALLSFLYLNCNAAGKVILKTVVIDAGHGGKDPGAVGKTTKEKEIITVRKDIKN